jgi:hypothetical protein
MAIIIPSSKTYDRQNPKVRDNVIERIEVGAVEVVPDNEYDIPVYSENVLLKENTQTQESNPKKEEVDYYMENDPNVPSIQNWYRVYAYMDSDATYATGTITIPKVKNNKWISTLNYGTDKWKIESSLFISKTTYPITGTVSIQSYSTIGQKNITVGDGKTTQTNNFPDMPSKVEEELGGASVTLSGVSNTTNLAVEYKDLENSYEIKYKVLQKLIEVQYSGSGVTDSGQSGDTLSLNGAKTEYIADKIEITIYGNTIGIDLVDKTVYIPETDTTSKKVFSVEGNELMQTSTLSPDSMIQEIVRFEDYEITHYNDLDGREEIHNQTYYGKNYENWDYGVRADILILNKNLYNKQLIVNMYYPQEDTVYKTILFTPTENNHTIIADAGGFYIGKVEVFVRDIAIVGFYSKTQYQYSNGKETAVIRCSIGDYYDESKNKVISIDNSTKKMSFKENDEVIPMVYNQYGQDQPISFYSGGEEPKKFKVLGVKKYYDGAVWQELTLQEIKKGE